MPGCGGQPKDMSSQTEFLQNAHAQEKGDEAQAQEWQAVE
jgi:hypothetical protein